MARAGRFEIRTTSPYPVWCEIIYDGKTVLQTVSHQELADLKYAVEKAMQEARALLQERDRWEV